MPSSVTTFPTWWSALAAVPADARAVDHWATPDGRFSRYDRLLRVWGDPTDGNPPPFYKIDKEKHVVPALWENFAIFSPTEIASGLYEALGFSSSAPALDVCWSCEFNLGHRDRQLDVVMHVRFLTHDEIILGEAKPRRKGFDAKDLNPSDILNHDAFRCAKQRRYFLLGDCPPPPRWNQASRGCLTWPGLCNLQLKMCDTLPEADAVRLHIKHLIAMQFSLHGIKPSAAGLVIEIESLEDEAARIGSVAKTKIVRDFVASAILHLRCMSGREVGSPPFAYLSAEPAVGAIKPKWRMGCGGRIVNEKPYWKLPERK